MALYTETKNKTTTHLLTKVSIELNFVRGHWSVIPTIGKRAAIKWSQYQQQRATAAQISEWFGLNSTYNTAILTGPVSSLIVLDFDDVTRYQQFIEQQPQLANTLTVATRRGYHLYYSCTAEIMPHSTSGAGIDLQAAGRYVIAPPSIVAGHHYKTVHDREPITLTVDQVQAICDFIQSHRPAPMPAQDAQEAQELPESVTAYYQAALKNGRNQALFAAALKARDDGQLLNWTANALAQVHASTRAPGEAESYEQRYSEALATITSAYSRPPRRATRPAAQIDDIPSAVKEALNRQKLTATWRTIQALRCAGIRAGHTFTFAEAAALLRGIVGNWSLRRALSEGKGAEIFDFAPPAPPLAQQSSAAYLPSDTSKTDALFLTGQNQPKLKMRSGDPGRPANLYRMPGNRRLCQILGVERLANYIIDPIQAEALKTAKTARIAMHRAYIMARPTNKGKEHRLGFLGQRLGVHLRTVQRYNTALNVPKSPCYEEISPIYWSNLSELDRFGDGALTDLSGGYFLMRPDGKRYPPLRSIAARQLAAKQRLYLYRRRADIWHYEKLADMPAPQPAQQIPAPPPAQQIPAPPPAQQIPPPPLEFNGEAEAVGRLFLAALFNDKRLADAPIDQEPPAIIKAAAPIDQEPPAIIKAAAAPIDQEPPAIIKMARKPLTAAQARRKFGVPLADSYGESLAQRIHSTCTTISQADARAMVYNTNPAIPLMALAVINKRKNVRNPAGLFITIVRSEARRQERQRLQEAKGENRFGNRSELTRNE